MVWEKRLLRVWNAMLPELPPMVPEKPAVISRDLMPLVRAVQLISEVTACEPFWMKSSASSTMPEPAAPARVFQLPLASEVAPLFRISLAMGQVLGWSGQCTRVG